jgi:probable rRNA maturation factor
MPLDIIAETRVPRGLRPALRRVMTALLEEHHVTSSVCIVLANDAKLRTLKNQFWGEDAATDVLSFPQWEPGDPFVPDVLGDIVISLETAERQARQQGHDLSSEVVELAAHGFTHLLGHDHQTDLEWQPFKAMQARALELHRGDKKKAREEQ